MDTDKQYPLKNNKWQRPFLPLIPLFFLLLFLPLSFYLPIQADDPPIYTNRHIIHPRLNDVLNALTGDLDGDGDPDVVTVSSPDDTLLWLENTDGNGRTWKEQFISFINNPKIHLLTDLDEDGDLDIIT
ncbi:MAG TPA: hypothetical protein ENK32_03650, partial [Anaerolineae bacterium]|nr:hypothetical protein [Anaerolineae bacterium]